MIVALTRCFNKTCFNDLTDAPSAQAQLGRRIAIPVLVLRAHKIYASSTGSPSSSSISMTS
jgi:hypothetical protein